MSYPYEEEVKEFMQAAGDVLPAGPTIPSEAVRRLRCHLLLDEALEYVRASGFVAIGRDGFGIDSAGYGYHLEAVTPPDLNAMAHENTDVLYVAFGNALAMGVPAHAPFDVVHTANMRKRGPDGTFVFRADGKIIKPVGWVPPDVGAEVERLRQHPATPRSCMFHKNCAQADRENPLATHRGTWAEGLAPPRSCNIHPDCDAADANSPGGSTLHCINTGCPHHP
jgi:predicted HAD superfamily Cof-like phosphohydrolase